ncbi:glycosyltransferase family 39 protein [Echinicola soli]|uniref:Glycosyltransferase family 39 protein n=1 Tax=Echinicola soli TaxID=2591634 RepID=A0A514CFD1_9BACT|nr:glycosyltransferase family 39 protein [Echinicola soli]QDH78506.1 glycosyltransferase family 39 protein [Echinicola soli]
MKNTPKDLVFLIGIFVLAKLLVHFITYENYELHRDAYLYYAQGEHLDWGFIAVPPLIAVLGKVTTSFFGNTVFALRFFPALIGAANVGLVGLSVKELGGKWLAISLACLAYLLSPSFLHSNTLFQPVTFNHFFWLLSSWLILRMIIRDNPKYWLWLSVVFGLGFLNKYSILFFFAAFLVGLSLTAHRRLYCSSYFAIGVALALVIISPNLVWQYQHNWPVMMHMKELRETQLVHVELLGFFVDQLLMNLQAIFLWFGSLILLLFYPKEKQYRIVGLMFLLLLGLLMAGSGKAYYTLGIYPVLFSFGAFYVEKYGRRYQRPIAVFLVTWMIFVLYQSLSFGGIPFMTVEKVAGKEKHRWEDGKEYDLPQDLADMTGWKEIGETVRDIYVGLGSANRNNCDVFCNNYAQAGSVMFYGKSVGIPQPMCTVGSFVLWSPDSLEKEYFILVDHDPGDEDGSNAMLNDFFEKVKLVKTIDNPYFRENGTNIYLCQYPTPLIKEHYYKLMSEAKGKYKR